MNGLCDSQGCAALSDVRPVLVIFSPLPNTCPARGMIGREYCAACAQRLTVDDFVNDEGWASIVRGFVSIGKMAPDRSRLQLVMAPLMHAERN